MNAVEIEWASAAVEDGRLTVSLSGAPKGFADELEAVVARLGDHGRGWGEVSVGKRKLHVEDVEQGAEEALRHFLESALLQANAAIGATADEPEDDEPSGPDAEMASVFRSFSEKA
jgi:hypothetical protein